MNKNIIAGFVVAIIVVGAGSFYGGMKYTSISGMRGGNRTFGSVSFGQDGQGGNGNRNRGTGMMGAAVGEILNKDATSITIKLPNGGSRLIMISSSTPVTKTEKGTLDDAAVGTQISAFGTPNSDGSISAEGIQIGNVFMRFGQGQTQGAGPVQN